MIFFSRCSSYQKWSILRVLPSSLPGYNFHNQDEETDVVLLLQPHHTLYSHCLHGSLRLYTSPRFWGKTFIRWGLKRNFITVRENYENYSLNRPCQNQEQVALFLFRKKLLVGNVTFSGVTILLSLTIFLNTVSEIIPITSDSPLIGKPGKQFCGLLYFWKIFL